MSFYLRQRLEAAMQGRPVAMRRTPCLLVLVVVAFSALVAGAATEVQDVRLGESRSLRGTYIESSPGIKTGSLINCARVRLPGLSRLRNFHKFAHVIRANVIASALPIVQFSPPKIHVCFHENSTLGLGQCGKDSWKALDKGKWSGIKSPFRTKYVDIRAVGSITDIPAVISAQEEFCFYRVAFFVLGVVLLVLAPIVSEWVPFYYSTAMTMGILLVVLVLLFQGMKLLPTGRKSSLYIIMYGSLVGLGTVLLRHITGLLAPILMELGFGEDMLKPVALFALIGITIMGAWLGYWGVRKFVLTSDGDVDFGTAQFVKWALRLVGAAMLLQSSYDGVFSVLALVIGVLISSIHRFSFGSLENPFQFCWPSDSAGFDTRRYRKKHVKVWKKKHTVTSTYGASSSSFLTPVSMSGKRVFVSPPSRGRLVPDQTFYSTFHHTPERKRISRAEWDDLTRECTLNAMQELVASPEFTEWAVDNAERISVLPQEEREERSEDEIELTADMDIDPTHNLRR